MQAFLYQVGDDSGMVSLGAFSESGSSEGWAVNDAGQVVGSSENLAFIYTDGKMYDLNTLIDPAHPLPAGVTLHMASDINNQGCIIAGGGGNGEFGDYLLCPIKPDPKQS
jgi:probable HAF family extracellular repeat protein